MTPCATFLRSRRQTSGSLRCGTVCLWSQACASFIICRCHTHSTPTLHHPPRIFHSSPFTPHPPPAPSSSPLLLLQPHVLRFCDERGVRDEASVVSFLKSTTMVPHPAACAAASAALNAAAGRAAASAAPHPRAQVPQQQQHTGAVARVSSQSPPCCVTFTPSCCVTVAPDLAHDLHMGYHLFTKPGSPAF